MAFKSWNKSGLVRREIIRVELKYYADGEMASQVKYKENGEWKHISTSYFEDSPSWDFLHKCHYILGVANCFQPPSAVCGLISRMKVISQDFTKSKKSSKQYVASQGGNHATATGQNRRLGS